MNKKEIQLDAVLDRNLVGIVQELGLEEDLLNGKLVCPECGKLLEYANIGLIRVLGDDVRLFCDDFAHLYEIHEKSD